MGVSGILASLKGMMPGHGSYRYSAIPAPATTEAHRSPRHVDGRERRMRLFKLSAGGMVLLAILVVVAFYGHVHPSPTATGGC